MHNQFDYKERKYPLLYHLLWCPKAGLQLRQEIYGQALPQIVEDICRTNNYELVNVKVHPLFIYVSLSVKPTVAPADAARTLKSLSTVRLLQLYPELKKQYSLQGSFWKKGYFISTGRIFNPETILKAIDEWN